MTNDAWPDAASIYHRRKADLFPMHAAAPAFSVWADQVSSSKWPCVRSPDALPLGRLIKAKQLVGWTLGRKVVTIDVLKHFSTGIKISHNLKDFGVPRRLDSASIDSLKADVDYRRHSIR